jgi:hypothetical protein
MVWYDHEVFNYREWKGEMEKCVYDHFQSLDRLNPRGFDFSCGISYKYYKYYGTTY